MEEELMNYKDKVNKELERLVDGLTKNKEGFLKYNYDMLKEYALRGGKRLRAIACIKAYESLIGKRDDRILLPSLSLELFHASSLVHDDIMDEDDLRRNEPSMHKMYRDYYLGKFEDKFYDGSIFSKDSARFSTSAAIIQGNILFSLGLFCLTDCSFDHRLRNEALALCQESYRLVNEGQLLDVLNESEKETSEEDYISMAALKTGILFASSMEIGAIFADVDKKTRKLFHDFGIYIAIAFQIQDDIMDISKEMKKGNTLGSDIMKGKRTLLMINALKKASKDEKDYLEKISGKSDASKEEIEKVISIFDKTGSIKRAKDLAKDYTQKGKICLEELKKEINEEGYQFFRKFADYMTKRDI